MDCKDVHARIVAGGSLDEASVRAHLQTCPACAELVEQDARLGRALAEEAASVPTAVPDLEALERETMTAVQAPASLAERVRQLSTPMRATVLTLGALLGVAFVAATSLRVDIGVFPVSRLIVNVAVLVGVMLWGGALLLRPLHRPPVRESIRSALPWALVLAPFALALLPAAHHDHPASLEGAGDDLVRRALACFAYGSAFSLPIAGLAWLTDRSALRARGAITIGLVGAAAVGNLILVVHCPLVAPVHRMAGHATVSVVFFVLALALARLGPKK